MYLTLSNLFIFNFNSLNKSSIKTGIKFCLFAIIIVSIISYILNVGVRNSMNGQIGKVNLILDKKNDPAIISFGSSVGEVGFNSNIIAKKTGLSVFNSCIDGTSYIQYKGLIDVFTKSSKNNRTVVFMESYFTFQNPGEVSSLERYISHLGNQDIYESLHYLQAELLWKCKYVPFYQYIPVTHLYYKNAFAGLKNYVKNATFNDSLNGYTPVYRSWEIDQDNYLKNTKPFHVPINKEVVEKYLATVNSLQKAGKKVVVVIPPVYKIVTEKLTDFNPLRETFKEISRKTGCVFIDFTSNVICNDKKYFYNGNHMNAIGSNLFSTQLADSLNALIPAAH